jgi:D-alanyl-lipoteichoic acid acyltransferase DltB (MBOAT superfamily)
LPAFRDFFFAGAFFALVLAFALGLALLFLAGFDFFLKDLAGGAALALAFGLAAAFGAAALGFAAFGALVCLMAVGAWLGSRRVWLLISLVNNLALLLFFKYARFVAENVNDVLAWLHAGLRVPDPATLMPHGLAYVLPVGISFFTFQSMSYTIDFYNGKVGRERDFLRFATFVCFFPQLMALAGYVVPTTPEEQGRAPQNLLAHALSSQELSEDEQRELARYLAWYRHQRVQERQ